MSADTRAVPPPAPSHAAGRKDRHRPATRTIRLALIGLAGALAVGFMAAGERPRWNTLRAEVAADAPAPVTPSTVLTSVATSAETPPSPSDEAVSGGPSPEGARILGHVQALAGSVGPRVSGGAGEAGAVDYVAGELRAYGYDVEVMRFSYEDGYLLPGAVDVGGERATGLAIGGTRAAQVTAAAVYVGRAVAAEFAGGRARGKVAVADREVPRLYETILNAQRGGAAALVLINERQGLMGGVVAPPVPLPVVAVGGVAGDALRAAARAGATVAVEAGGGASREALNVLARPAPDARCEALVGGHHDTVPDSPGANDNASGAATVLELARAFAAAHDPGGQLTGSAGRPGMSVCFATFGAEESWYLGSQVLAQHLHEAGALPRLMVNLDVTGIGQAVEVTGSPEAVEAALAAAQERGIVAGPGPAPETMVSDHRPFLALGVPVLYLTSGQFATVHSAADVAGGVNPASLQRVADLAAASIQMLVSATD